MGCLAAELFRDNCWASPSTEKLLVTIASSGNEKALLGEQARAPEGHGLRLSHSGAKPMHL